MHDRFCLSYINNTNGFFEENAKPTRIICPELLINTENPLLQICLPCQSKRQIRYSGKG